MATNNVNIKIKADSSEASSGIKKVQADLNKFSKTGLNKTTKEIQGLGKAVKGLGLTAIISAEVKALKSLCKGIQDTAQAYNEQLKVEKSLEIAAKNNPYLNNQAVKQLKEYASYLQSVSTTGDEVLIPLMAQLAAAGRKQDEIQKIMAASLDVAASGAMSLEEAVKSLNKTYSGISGTLGNTIAEVKTLTAEQLRNGEAVDIVAEKYKGMAEETAKATGAYEQMQNAAGDLREEIGKITKPATDAWYNWWRSFYETGIIFVKKMDEMLTQLNIHNNDAVNNWISAQAKYGGNDKNSKKLNYRTMIKAEGNTASLEAINKYLMQKGSLNEDELLIQQELNRELGRRREIEKELQDAELARIKAEAEARDAAAAAGSKSSGKTSSSTASSSGASVEEVDEFAKHKALTESWANQQEETLQFQKQMLQNYADYLAKKENLTEEEIAMQEKLQQAQANIDEAIKQDQKNNLAELLANVNSYVSEFAQITQQMTDLIRSANEAETNQQMADLDQQYADGLMSYEDYCDKKEQIDKEAAQKEYRLKMWEWSSSLLTATANIAEGVSKAIAQGGLAGIITGALVAASGALQIATLTANKPRPPQFASGGIVPGSSYYGDNVQANVNSGEMILNAAQQKQLWQMANGNAAGGVAVNVPVNIENNTDARVSANWDMNQLKITIDKMVDTSMRNGRFNNSMQIADTNKSGVKFL